MNPLEEALFKLKDDFNYQAYHIPEKVLVAAVLELAFRDLLCDQPHIYKRAISWFLWSLPRNRETPFFYFLDCCEILELSGEQIKFLRAKALEKSFSSVKGMLQTPYSGGSNVPAYSAFSKRVRVVRYRSRKIKAIA